MSLRAVTRLAGTSSRQSLDSALSNLGVTSGEVDVGLSATSATAFHGFRIDKLLWGPSLMSGIMKKIYDNVNIASLWRLKLPRKLLQVTVKHIILGLNVRFKHGDTKNRAVRCPSGVQSVVERASHQ
jgi:hypothetical protein